jgi:hypothetical protein
MASRNAEREAGIIRGTKNVFADLGYPDAAERQAKLRLAYALNQVLEQRKLSQAEASLQASRAYEGGGGLNAAPAQ